jgi:hypothetical protein
VRADVRAAFSPDILVTSDELYRSLEDVAV